MHLPCLIRRPPRRKVSRQDLPPTNLSLLRVLKRWRQKAANGQQVYRVAHTSALEGIASLCPSSLDRLEEISGIGPHFISKYGDEVISIVEEHCTRANERTR